MIDFPNDQLDKYQLIELLGEGGMGFVYRAKLFDSDIEVALKYCKFSDETFIKRFKREVRAIRGVEHKNIMQIIDMNLDFSPPYYTMPLADCSTFDILNELSRDPDQAIDIFLEVCHGVQALHNAGQCHRDIKPQNIMVMLDSSIVVSDFGLVKFMDRDSTMLTKTTALLGTEIYMAPEQFLPEGARNADARTDIYQLGKTLYHLYTGKFPALLSDDGVPAGLWYIIQKAVRQNPNERFANVAEFIDSINDYKASQDPHHNPEESFCLIIQEINDKLINNVYEKHKVEALVMLLMSISDDDDFFLQLFDQIPPVLLRAVVSDMPEDVKPLIVKYSEIIERSVKNRSFAYAEVVAEKMSDLYKATNDMTIKQAALTSVLCAAVDLNRFKAINVFNSLIINVTSQEEALLVADVLKLQLSRYKYVFSQISKNQLNALIQAVWEQASEK